MTERKSQPSKTSWFDDDELEGLVSELAKIIVREENQAPSEESPPDNELAEKLVKQLSRTLIINEARLNSVFDQLEERLADIALQRFKSLKINVEKRFQAKLGKESLIYLLPSALSQVVVEGMGMGKLWSYCVAIAIAGNLCWLGLYSLTIKPETRANQVLVSIPSFMVSGIVVGSLTAGLLPVLAGMQKKQNLDKEIGRRLARGDLTLDDIRVRKMDSDI